MNRKPRIALFAPSAPHFVMTLKGFKEGFEAAGAEVHVGWPLLDARMLTAFVASFRPDLLFEINRTRDQIAGLEGNVLHAAWFEAGRYETASIADGLGGSDWLYFMLPPELMGLDLSSVRDWSYLWPGVDPGIFYRDGSQAEKWDLSLVGHLYPPLPEKLLETELRVDDIGVGPFGDFVELIGRLPLSSLPLTPSEVHAWLVEQCGYRGVRLDPGRLDGRSMFLFEELLLRLHSRRTVANAMLAVSGDVRFFGNAGWAMWSEYAPYYGGEILAPQALADVYRHSALNVHITPWPYHFRTFDCMGCGAAVMINRTGRHSIGPAFEQDFTPGEHYVEYGDDDFVEVARRMLHDAHDRRRIGAAAASLVAGAHTWRHRAIQILGDLGLGGYGLS